MTREAQKADERGSLLHFLERWSEGAEWRLVEEIANTENPDFLLQRVDGSETVGVELRRASFEPLAQADAVAEAIADELEDQLHTIHVERLGVLLFFQEASALAIGVRRKRREAIHSLAKLIAERLPIEGSTKINPEELRLAGIHAISGVVIIPTNELTVVNAGASASGVGVHVVQPYIDEKAERLPRYRSNGAVRSAALCSSARFTGVWLVVTLMDGPGLSSSISSGGAESELKRRGFDRAFLLDRWEGARRVIELVG